MPKKLPPQGGEPIRGGDALNITQNGYSGNIPTAGIIALEQELTGLAHGTATLTIHIKDGQLVRYAASRERSFVPGKATTGGRNGE
jgi:hypothetical protein